MKIACLCAFPRDMNYGMLSVDLAFEDFCKETLQKEPKITHFNIEEACKISCGNSRRIEYQLLGSPSKQLNEFDLIVIWGDFTTSITYKNSIINLLSRKRGLTEDDAIERYYKGFLLEDLDTKILKKVMIVSSNILPNTALEMSERYRKAVNRLYKNAAGIIPRDAISTYMSQIYRGSDDQVTCGVDAAFFLSTQQPTSSTSEGCIGFSFGREAKAKKSPLKKLAIQNFMTNISRQSGLPLKDISWRVSKGEPELLFSKIEEIQCCRIVVTDTYHCAVTALREGIPVIALGNGSKHQSGTLGSKKKEILLHQLMLQNLYIYIDNYRFYFKSKSVASEALNHSLDSNLKGHIEESIEAAKKIQKKAFKKSIEKMIHKDEPI